MNAIVYQQVSQTYAPATIVLIVKVTYRGWLDLIE